MEVYCSWGHPIGREAREGADRVMELGDLNNACLFFFYRGGDAAHWTDFPKFHKYLIGFFRRIKAALLMTENDKAST